MAIYSTFFVYDPAKLSSLFPVWDAMNILGPIVDLARKMSNDQRLYLLVEA